MDVFILTTTSVNMHTIYYLNWYYGGLQTKFLEIGR